MNRLTQLFKSITGYKSHYDLCVEAIHRCTSIATQTYTPKVTITETCGCYTQTLNSIFRSTELVALGQRGVTYKIVCLIKDDKAYTNVDSICFKKGDIA